VAEKYETVDELVVAEKDETVDELAAATMRRIQHQPTRQPKILRQKERAWATLPARLLAMEPKWPS